MKLSRLALILTLMCLSVPALSAEPARTVRVIYLVSADREPSGEYAKAIEMAIRDIQTWYARQLDGATFRLNDPVVEVLKSDKPAAWFYANPRKSQKDNWGYDNTFSEVSRLAGAKHFDANYVWVVYSDGPGNKGRGGSGVCIMPEDDLLGLTGNHPQQKDIARWIAGLGHELGHAFGLPHPKNARDMQDAIMGNGIYGKYPDQTYLTKEDKSILLKSAFFFDKKGNPVTGLIKPVVEFSYRDGVFARYRDSKTKGFVWEEITLNGNAFRFSESSAAKNAYELRAVDRNIWIRIPFAGGKAEISTDSGKSWRFFQNVELQRR